MTFRTRGVARRIGLETEDPAGHRPVASEATGRENAAGPDRGSGPARRQGGGIGGSSGQRWVPAARPPFSRFIRSRA